MAAAAAAVVRLRRLTLLSLAVLSCLQTVTPAAAASQLFQPLPRPQAAEDGVELRRRACTYTVKVKTSCASPARASDAVSLAFGDAYRNEVYVAQLTPRPGFERCATDTFRVSGPCGYGVCYLYLRRAGGGGGGWTPEWVQVYEPTSSTPSTFYYGGGALPAGVWYGFNRCVRQPAAAAADSSSVAAAQSM